MCYVSFAEIDLDAISANLAAIKQRCPDQAILAPVKANGYGHGAVELAKHLQKTGLVDFLGVATVPEGIELRSNGITLPILKFSQCFDEDLSALLAAEMVPTVVDAHTIEAMAKAAQQGGYARYPVQLAVDTGMGRVGCKPGQASELAALVEASGLELQGIFTHLPISDCDEGVAFTTQEIAGFATLVEQIQRERAAANLPPVRYVHAANSGAVLGHQLPDCNMIRPGILIYGYPPAAGWGADLVLRPALSWKSKVSFVKTLSAEQSVSYGRTWFADEDSWIATVPVGYADGYWRGFSNNAEMLIGGRRYPVVGRVCMDQTMLNLGPASEPCPVSVGDEVVICGAQGDEAIWADQLADWIGTISYEITCGISARVERVYVGG